MTKLKKMVIGLTGLIFIIGVVQLVFRNTVLSTNIREHKEDVYSLESDPWCIHPRYRVVEVKGDFVKLSNGSVDIAESKNIFNLLYVKDKYNCKAD